MKKQLFFILLLFTIITVKSQVPQHERDALLALYNSTNGPGWTNNLNWNTTTPVADWHGITVTNIGGTDHVTEINIINNNLQGVIPNEIGNFSELQTLFLYNNSGIHGEIPNEIGNLLNLTRLALFRNNMTGNIPTSITNLINLQYIDLGNNNFSGVLPIGIQNFSQLENFNVYNNNLEGIVPDLSGISTLESLVIAYNYFHFADFENEFNHYNSLDWFNYNIMKKFDDEIEYDLTVGNTYSFEMSEIRGANITYQWYKNGEEIPGATNRTYTITNAQNIDAANYHCEATSANIPELILNRNTIHIYDEILPADLNALTIFYYATDGNNWTDNTNWNSTNPVYTWNGVNVQGNRVISINLPDNNLGGSLPTQLGNLNALKSLTLNNNNIAGTIPTTIEDLIDLEYLNLSVNEITGNIPTQIETLDKLEYLLLNYNQLTGNLPNEIGSLSSLKSLGLRNNQIAGNLPNELGNCTDLEYFSITNNDFTGNLPSTFENLIKMKRFWLEGNQFTGNVPDIFSNMPDLEYLLFDGIFGSSNSNQISGTLDLSSNPKLYALTIVDSDITSVDVRNINNSSSPYFYFSGNPNLTCIYVDDATYSSTTWTNVDATSTFVETEAECDALFTYIPDDNFEQELIDLGLDNILDDKVRTSNINSITTLDLDGLSISNLTGIEDFIGLTELNCFNNSITSLDVSSNINLINLYISGNPIGTLDISQNPMLEILYCSNNQLSTLDISNNSNLKQLGAANNNLTSINLAQNPNLTYLVVNNNSLTSIDVSNLTLLQHFMFEDNQISTIDLNNNLELTGLYCKNNLLTDLNVSQNQNLYRLNCSNNNLFNLNVKNTNNTNFTDFDARNNINLSCIFVDDTNYSTTNWLNIDSTSNFVETEVECTALNTNDLSINNKISIYPNPTSGKIFVENNSNSRLTEIVIMNAIGQKINIHHNMQDIDLSNLNNGIYYIKIKDDNQKTSTFKINKN
jgi:Leucine-rich repeat (LRR) protein